ncbi:hypothetical protein Q1W71_02720 [Flavobacterium pectinovorum]|uniref:hypothetical protein n=1 Tax=Flavobacterium pectinovorum TaxID=29533 RepID=UPI00265D9D7C|nr:hypothetical protein [Flavobacterium pectinovorum]WKL48702.1 hypothetical protein Q1W71_02720 [Flavobacterium pectinovorum]
MRQDLLDEINLLADSLAKVSAWKNSKDAFGHIIGEKKAQNNYIYEFYCYMKILEDLSKNPSHKINFIIGNGIFPRGPAPKSNRPYFVLEKDNIKIFQICSGTQIETKVPNIEKAPDISFQAMSSDPDLPNYEDILAIYDAKYSDSNSTKSFQEGQMSSFNKMIRFLEQDQPNIIHLYYTNFNDFKGNCLITNKQSYTDNKAELAEEMITVVEFFDQGETFRVI